MIAIHRHLNPFPFTSLNGMDRPRAMRTALSPRFLEPQMKKVSRYHPVLVVLHWLLALLIIAMLVMGFFVLATTPNTDPHKIDVLEMHMAAGMLILALMLIRFVVRMCTARPAQLPTGHGIFDRIAAVAHYGFYVLILLMVGTGYATGILARLPAIVFARNGEPLPPGFAVFPTWVAHRALAVLLLGLIVLHVAGVCYHQFAKKDGIFQRMRFGRRSSASLL